MEIFDNVRACNVACMGKVLVKSIMVYVKFNGGMKKTCTCFDQEMCVHIHDIVLTY